MDNQLQYQYLQTLGISQYVPKDTVYDDVAAESMSAIQWQKQIGKCRQLS